MSSISPFRSEEKPWSTERVKFDLCLENGLRGALQRQQHQPLRSFGFAENRQPFLLGEAFLNPRESSPVTFWSEQRGGIISASFLAIFSG